MKSSMRITLVLLTAAIAAVGCGKAATPTDEYTVKADMQKEQEAAEALHQALEDAALQNTEEDSSDTEALPLGEVSEDGSFYFAQRHGSESVVYSFNPNTQEQTEVFRFDEYSEYRSAPGNYYSDAPASIDFSPQRNEFVYSTGENVYFYNVDTQETTPFLTSTADETKEIDGVPVRVWSRDFTGHNNDWSPTVIATPEYSPSGKYLVFHAGYYEGADGMFYDFASDTFQVLAAGQDQRMAGSAGQWVGDDYLAVRSEGYADVGVYYATAGQYDSAREIMNIPTDGSAPYVSAYQIDPNTLVYGKQHPLYWNEEEQESVRDHDSEFGLYDIATGEHTILATYNSDFAVNVVAADSNGALYYTDNNPGNAEYYDYYWYDFATNSVTVYAEIPVHGDDFISLSTEPQDGEMLLNTTIGGVHSVVRLGTATQEKTVLLNNLGNASFTYMSEQ